MWPKVNWTRGVSLPSRGSQWPRLAVGSILPRRWSYFVGDVEIPLGRCLVQNDVGAFLHGTYHFGGDLELVQARLLLGGGLAAVQGEVLENQHPAVLSPDPQSVLVAGAPVSSLGFAEEVGPLAQTGTPLGKLAKLFAGGLAQLNVGFWHRSGLGHCELAEQEGQGQLGKFHFGRILAGPGEACCGRAFRSFSRLAFSLIE